MLLRTGIFSCKVLHTFWITTNLINFSFCSQCLNLKEIFLGLVLVSKIMLVLSNLMRYTFAQYVVDFVFSYNHNILQFRFHRTKYFSTFFSSSSFVSLDGFFIKLFSCHTDVKSVLYVCVLVPFSYWTLCFGHLVTPEAGSAPKYSVRELKEP